MGVVHLWLPNRPPRKRYISASREGGSATNLIFVLMTSGGPSSFLIWTACERVWCSVRSRRPSFARQLWHFPPATCSRHVLLLQTTQRVRPSFAPQMWQDFRKGRIGIQTIHIPDLKNGDGLWCKGQARTPRKIFQIPVDPPFEVVP